MSAHTQFPILCYDALDPREPEMKGMPTIALVGLGVVGSACSGCAEPRRQRTIEPWLSESTAHSPCIQAGEGHGLVAGGRCAVPDRAQRLPEDQRLRGNAEAGSGPELLSDAALAQVVARASGETSVKRLLQAKAARPHHAKLASMLAAAYLVRAGESDDPGDLARALEAAGEAVDSDAGLASAWFNRGLALAKLGLRKDAAEAFATSRALSLDSGWAEEALEREKALTVPPAWDGSGLEEAALGSPATLKYLVAANRQAARDHVERELLGDWGDAVVAGDFLAAERRLDAARAIGATLRELGGDRLIADAVAAIDRARQGSSSLSDLAQAHRVFRKGFELYRVRKMEEAIAVLRRASAALRHYGSPLALAADFYVASSLYLEVPSAAQAELTALSVAPYPALKARVLWIQALGDSYAGASPRTIARFEEALDLFRDLRERDNAAAIESQIGERLHQLGRRREGWRHLYSALQVTAGFRDPALASMIFKNAAECALAEGLPRAALAFHQEAVRQARKTYPMRSVEALLARAEASAALGQHEEALRDLREAEATIPEIDDQALRTRKQAELDLIFGTALIDSNPELALTSLSSALAGFAAEKNLLATLRVRLARARAFDRLGRLDLARQDLHACLAVYEKLGANLKPGLRLAFLGVTDKLFDQLIRLTSDRPEISFKYAEQARSRIVSTKKAARTVSFASLAQRLPGDTVLVEYALLEDRLVAWVVPASGSPFHLVTQISRRKVEELVAQMRSLEETLRSAASRRLFEILVQPWIDRVPTGEHLVFIPDKALHGVPFSALVDPRTSEFLVESYSVAEAPSASSYVAGSPASRAPTRLYGKATLVFGDPAFVGELYPHLDRLGGATAEADQIAKLWDTSALIGESATEEAFVADAPKARILHVASHAVIDPKDPLLSALLLAPSAPGDSGVLTAGEIYKLPLEGVELAVLSGCDTGTLSGTEGVTSLARAFHAAGVPTVIASLWRVDDLAATGFVFTLHRHLRAGLDPAAALREAQLAFLHSQDRAQRSPPTWAAFIVFGGGHREN